jgi:hypothetical protein
LVTQRNVLGDDDGDSQWESEGHRAEDGTDPKTDGKTSSYATVANRDEGQEEGRWLILDARMARPHPRRIRLGRRYRAEEGRWKLPSATVRRAVAWHAMLGAFPGRIARVG